MLKKFKELSIISKVIGIITGTILIIGTCWGLHMQYDNDALAGDFKDLTTAIQINQQAIQTTQNDSNMNAMKLQKILLKSNQREIRQDIRQEKEYLAEKSGNCPVCEENIEEYEADLEEAKQQLEVITKKITEKECK